MNIRDKTYHYQPQKNHRTITSKRLQFYVIIVRYESFQNMKSIQGRNGQKVENSQN